jgi:Txe/YoeB family toxin of Txe-Axe toxin-antitoxin module
MTTMNDFVAAGQILARSGLLGIANEAQGFLVACTCKQTGISFIEFKQTYHIINNQLSKRSDKMQADFQKAGGTVEIIQKDSNGSVVKLTHGKTSYTSRCIWEEIKNEPFAKTKNYETPRKRMQMMWARAISDGVRTVWPEAVAGVYTPEEVETFDSEEKLSPSEASQRAQSIATAQPQQVQVQVSQPVYTSPQEPSVVPQAQRQPTAYELEAEASIGVPANTPPPANEPTPFTIIEEQKNPDYSLCPIQGHLFRVKWETMPNEHLDAALTVAMPQGYLNYVQNLLTARKTTQQP